MLCKKWKHSSSQIVTDKFLKSKNHQIQFEFLEAPTQLNIQLNKCTSGIKKNKNKKLVNRLDFKTHPIKNNNQH